MIDVNARQFRDAVKMVGKCVERRNTVPILSAMKVRVNGKMEISGTDMDMTMDVALPCQPSAGRKPREGAFLIENPSYVVKAVAAAGGNLAQFTLKDNGYGLTVGALSVEAASQCALEDYPVDQSAVVSAALEASLSADQMRQIGRVSAAISKEETRYYLNGVYFHHIADWTWRAVATNGHLLMYVDLQLPDAKGNLAGVIIPRKALRVALESLGRATDGVVLSIGGGMLVNREDSTAPVDPKLARLSWAGVVDKLGIRVSTKAIDGTFPDYVRVIPKFSDIQLIMRAQKLRQAINSVAFAFARTPAVKLSFVNDELVVTAAHAPDGMSAAFRCDAQHNAPAGFTIGFNGQYLLDCLNALRGDDLAMALTDCAGPAVIRDAGDTAFCSVLMPMRV